jgi:hypothetical protein
MMGVVENGNDVLKELRTSSLQLKMELSMIEPAFKVETDKILNEMMNINPNIEKIDDGQKEI